MLGRSAWSLLVVMLVCMTASVHAQSAGISLSGSDKGVTATTTSAPPAAAPATTAPTTPAAAANAAPASTAIPQSPAPQVDPAAATAVPATAAGASEMDAGTYSVRLRDLEHN